MANEIVTWESKERGKRIGNEMEIDGSGKMSEAKRRRLDVTNKLASIALRKVISGGQTGADRAALEAAREQNFETGGTAPHRFMTINGPDPSLQTVFGLKEIKKMRRWQKIRGTLRLLTEYQERSMCNVDDAQATIAFRLCASAGTDGTINYCKTGLWSPSRLSSKQESHRPLLVVNQIEDESRAIFAITRFLIEHSPAVLNVCGHRNDSTAGYSGYTDKVKYILARVFSAIKKSRIDNA